MYPASNKQLHVWASIILGITQVERMVRQNKPIADIKQKRAWQDEQLTLRIQAMGMNGWLVEPDEQDMFGCNAQEFIRKQDRRFYISEAFSMRTARQMFRDDIYVSIAEIHSVCEPSRVS